MAKNMTEECSAFHGFMKTLRMGLFFALLVSIFLILPGQTVFAQGTGSITGIVLANGSPLANASVYAYAQGPGSGFTTSAADGTYTITGLTAGSYTVYASGNGWVTQYYNLVNSYQSATAVAVTSGGTTSNINFNLVAGATITGTVRGPGGTPVSGETVYARTVSVSGIGTVGLGATAADGTYTITGLPAGIYLVHARMAPRLYYNNVTDSGMATAVIVTSGGTTSGIDLNWSAGGTGTITGTVRGPGGTPLEGVMVLAGNLMLNGSAAITAADGTYTISGLPAGSYGVSCLGTGFANQYYNNAYSYSTATPVSVTSGGTTSNVNFDLVASGFITGTVRGPDGNPVAYTPVMAGLGFPGTTDANGTYTISGLLAGSHLVYVNPFMISPAVFPQFYNNADHSSRATPVAVTSGGTTSNINFNMVLAVGGGTIKGRITFPGGLPCPTPMCGVTIFDAASSSNRVYQVSSSSISNDGNYETGPLPAGSYKVAAVDSVSLNIGRDIEYYWPATTNIDDAFSVPVTVGVATPNINIEIDPFNFTNHTGVARSTVVTSNNIFAWWLNADAGISITGGEYSVNGGAFTSAPGTVSLGSFVKVRQTSSPSYGTTTNATLTIGGVSGTFSVTTLANAPPVIPTPPTGGIRGTSITINGSNFGAVQGGSYVDFNGVQGTVSYWSDTRIVVIVPSGATSGALRVVTSQGASSNISFTVYPPECGAPVKVAGSNYFTIQDAYNNAATGSTVQITEGLFNAGNLEFNRNIGTRVVGGYDCGYSVKTGYSTVDGSVTIKNGSVTVEGLIIK